ncbi:MAG: thiol:disulfide interchange protein DsbA/DsbL [Burkholderiales bacterium]|nr:thiol:disulfide interchange protein DsbA/DsbL [Burkholderiales bacterium]
MQRQRRRLLLAAAAWPLAVRAAQRIEPFEGVDYRSISPQPTGNPGRIEVIEFFYYGCTWCYQAQPYVQEWLERKPADVDFRYQPAIRNTRWLVLTKAFFVLQALGELPRLHLPLYRAYHRDDVNVEDEAVLTGWALKQGIQLKAFEGLLASDEIMAKVQRAREATYAYEVESTPSMVVDGRYLTSSGMSGGVVQMIEVMEALVAQERAQRRPARRP